MAMKGTMLTRAWMILLPFAVFAFNAQVYAQAPAGWKSVKDRSGRCKASVPGEWTVGAGVLTGTALGPDHRSAVVLAGVQEDAQKGMSATKLRDLGAATVFENTPTRTFFVGSATRPTDRVPSQLKYTVQVAGTPACTAQITVPNGQDEAIVKQIVASVGPAK
jgi:hypothetical protein